MGTQTARQIVIVAIAGIVMYLMGTGLALAALGDTIPHGGHDTSTDACLQCHDVHEAKGDYVLSRWTTVTQLCGSCHTLYQRAVTLSGDPLTSSLDPVWAVRWDGGTGGTPPYDEPTLTAGDTGGIIPQDDGGILVNYNPKYSGLEAPVPGQSTWNPTEDPCPLCPTVPTYEPDGLSGNLWANDIDGLVNTYDAYDLVGQGAPFDAYQKPLAYADGSDGRRGHRLGTAFALGASVAHADGVTDSLDYIPGGSSRLTAIRTPSVADVAVDVGYDFFLPTTSVSEFPVSLNGGLYCASCHSPHGQLSGEGFEGEDLDGDLVPDENNSNMISPNIIAKLLSKRPNHAATAADLEVADGKDWLNDGGREYCGKCHDKRMSNTVGEEPHNHPDFACLQCHGDESVIMLNNYYPGTEVQRVEQYDFPHTSANPNLLTQEPDGLCLNCHAPGALPLP